MAHFFVFSDFFPRSQVVESSNSSNPNLQSQNTPPNPDFANKPPPSNPDLRSQLNSSNPDFAKRKQLVNPRVCKLHQLAKPTIFEFLRLKNLLVFVLAVDQKARLVILAVALGHSAAQAPATCPSPCDILPFPIVLS